LKKGRKQCRPPRKNHEVKFQEIDLIEGKNAATTGGRKSSFLTMHAGREREKKDPD